ncbi:MAG: hypothetical protein B6U95_07590 [Thermofilum sp. ex4484_82]|nr:MAG: hypothetical protein B6U95_07590 [Thermofilum sp. ex4484_82]OYT37020.1 MAG: hypothetical protein B6U96_07585 [Archaeoglobales archaeon ex4484_92]
MGEIKVEVLKKIQEFRDRSISPDFGSLEKEGFDKSILKTMIKEGLINWTGGFSLTDEKNCIELIILYERIEKNLKALYKWKKYLERTYSSSKEWSYIAWKENIKSELKEAKTLVTKYNTIKPKNCPIISFLGYEIKTWTTVDEVVAIITKTIRTLEDVRTSLSLILKPQLSEDQKQTLDSLRKELENLEALDIDENIIRNLKEVLIEAENNHFLACSLISGRVILYCVEQIKGNTDEEKLNELINSRIIPKDEKSKETSKWFLKAIKSARHAISHKISIFPSPSEMFSILGDSFKIVRIFHRYSKIKGVSS